MNLQTESSRFFNFLWIVTNQAAYDFQIYFERVQIQNPLLALTLKRELDKFPIMSEKEQGDASSRDETTV
jgi:hypothetical protein